jgi:hypothetical protein
MAAKSSVVGVGRLLREVMMACLGTAPSRRVVENRHFTDIGA